MAGKLVNEDDLFMNIPDRLKIKSSAEDYEIRYKMETGMSAPKVDPFVFRITHREDYRKMCRQRKSFSMPMTAMITYNGEVSYAPLNTLARTKMSELRVNIRAKGLYLLARTIEQPVVTVGIQTVIEDHTGDVFPFLVYHMFDPELALRPEDVLPIGTVFILKEPLLQTSSELSHVIKCNSPTDIVLIDACHDLFQDISGISWMNEIEYDVKPCVPCTTEEWKKLGNDNFQKNKFREALRAYFMALKENESDNIEMLVILYSNISAVYLKIGSFESGLLYSKKALDLNPSHLKALYRSGRAHYELRQYGEASQYFKMLMKLDPKNKESADELVKCSARLDEQNGNVNIQKLFLTKIHKPQTEIDCADFMGPIKIVDVPQKGKGIVATEYVKPGTLLCVSKAVSVAFDDPLQDVASAKEVENNVIYNFKLVTKVTQKISQNPKVFGRLVYQLSANGYVAREEIFCDEKSEMEPVTDSERIRRIVDTNGFRTRSYPNDETNGSALFHVPSCFNHSCLCNALWEIYNDVMVIHAVQPISRGEEICITYHDSLDLYFKREFNISKHGFHCLCLLCKLDRDESQEIHVRRKRLIRSAERFSSADKLYLGAISVLSSLISEVERTYDDSGRSKLKCCLFPLYLHLSSALIQIEHLEESKKNAEKAFNALGLSSKGLLKLIEKHILLPKQSLIHPGICSAMELIVVYYFKSGRIRDTQKWIKALLAFEKICSGGNVNVAKIKYDDLRVLLSRAN